jgi:general secretion pathway protein E
MIAIREINDIQLQPLEIGEVPLELAIKNHVLFSEIGGQPHICLSEKKLSLSLAFLSKYALHYPITFLDDDSYERLYNRYLELRTDTQLSGTLPKEEQRREEEEEEFSVAELLRTQSDLLSSEESAPIIKFVNSLFYQALKKRASDIHLEVHENRGIVRYRIDGALVKHVELDIKIMNLVISRIKVISNLDISEKRVSQDGRTQIKIAGKTLDIRVSVLPTFYGERIVMRILMQSDDIPHMQELGFEAELVAEFDKLLKNPHGIILVTGPTGSGKSTTLHSFLQAVATPEKNIITVEDPVEYKADNINQVQANAKVGLSFAAGLRSILRQDPDVIMIGEIRDSETASIAIQAALTGHLVFSTLHTNNATSSITRLIDMGVEHFLVSSAILGILAQRLARKLCPACKEEDVIAEEFAADLGLPAGRPIFKAKGCSACAYTGYKGRVAIGELFILDEAVKIFLKTHPDDHEIRTHAVQNGMRTLQDQLRDLVLSGVTSVDEAIRIGIKET